MCKGAAAILNKKAAAINKIPFSIALVIKGSLPKSAENNKERSWKFVVPVHPYKIEIPNNNKAEEKEPKIKYFNPASVEKVESFFAAARTYKHKLCISIARYNESKSYELTRNIKPRIAPSSNKEYSKLLIFNFKRDSSKSNKQIILLMSLCNWP